MTWDKDCIVRCPRVLFPFGSVVCHTHTKHQIKRCWKDSGSGSHSETSDPSDWRCQLLSVWGGGAEAAGGSWSMPVPPHSGGPGAPAWWRGVDRLAQPPQRCLFLTHARVYEQLAMAQCRRSELSHRVGRGVSVLTLLAGSRSHKSEREDVVAETGLCSVRNRFACPCSCARQIDALPSAEVRRWMGAWA